MIDYTPYVGLPYEEPNGCLRLVEHVYHEAYGIDIAGLDAGTASARARMARLWATLEERCVPIEVPDEGDLAILRGLPCHIGIVIEPPLILHAEDVTSVVSDWTRQPTKSLLIGFYRYVGQDLQPAT